MTQDGDFKSMAYRPPSSRITPLASTAFLDLEGKPAQGGKRDPYSGDSYFKDSLKHASEDKETQHADPSKKRKRSRRRRTERHHLQTGPQTQNRESTIRQANAFTSTQYQPRSEYHFHVPTPGSSPLGFDSTPPGQIYFHCSTFYQGQGQPPTAEPTPPPIPPPTQASSGGPQLRLVLSSCPHPKPSQLQSAPNQENPSVPTASPVDHLSLAWATYCAKWDAIEQSYPSDIEVKQIPWPVIFDSFQKDGDRSLPPLKLINDYSVSEVLFSSKRSVGVSRKKLVEDALKWYHPDHFEQMVVARI
ncbi:hypothetical protein M407DRAFT_4055 [Tulasnella calospora MUT 4182]|uniref:Uncharacterized protein n=1 Tax=Tulasnella calospora MUT 4182 TaxID=1051891 RepID=A0A0C3LH49_9AGAM|nr:hypothetical protein M407DRAFT_4055 [Tulasnella calospora MUT 4182]